MPQNSNALMDIPTIIRNTRTSIQDDIDVFDEELPERFAVAWYGYIVGMIQWAAMPYQAALSLVHLLPDVGKHTPFWMQRIVRRGQQPFPQGDLEDVLTEQLRDDRVMVADAWPEAWTLAWGGCLAGLMEYRILEFGAWARLDDTFPKIEKPNPITAIFTGRRDVESFAPYLADAVEIEDARLRHQTALAWRAYFGGLWQYGTISSTTYRALRDLLRDEGETDVLGTLAVGRGKAPALPPPDIDALLQARMRENAANEHGFPQDERALVWQAYVLSLQFQHLLEYETIRLAWTLFPALSPDPTCDIRTWQ